MNTPEGAYPMSYCNDTIYSNWTSDNPNLILPCDVIESLNVDTGSSSDTIENKLINVKSELLESIDNSFKNEIEKDESYQNEIKDIQGNIILIQQIYKKIEDQNKKVIDIELNYKKAIEETKKSIENIDTFTQFLKTISQKFPDNDETTKIAEDICELSLKIKNDNNCMEIRKSYQKELYLLNEYHNLLKKINNGNVGNTCSLCLQNPVNKYFNPCGHTACDKCIDHLYEKSEDVYNVNCFLCRKKINSNHPIYFI